MTQAYILPAGYGPLGFAEGIDFVSPAKPPAFLADDIDPLTGELNTILAGIDPVDGAVIQLTRTRRNSGVSVMGLGHRFGEIKKVEEESALTRVRAYAEEMYAPLTQRGDIRIDDIKTAVFGPLGDGIAFNLTYTNLPANRQKTLRIL